MAREELMQRYFINVPRRKWRLLFRDWQLYSMLLLPVAFYVLFKYMPMYGTIIAFKKYSAKRGIWESKWVGLTRVCSHY